MRGKSDGQATMFVMINMEEKVPADHPLRAIKRQAAKPAIPTPWAFSAASLAVQSR